MELTRKFLTTKEVEIVYNIPKRTLEDWRLRGIGPSWSKPHGRVLYSIANLDAFFAAAQVLTADDRERMKVVR